MSKNSDLRKAWKKYECNRELMRQISFGPEIIWVAPEGVEAWQALYSVMEAHGYHVRIEDTDSYNCRNIKGTDKRSLHAFGIALDVNWKTNPWRDHSGNREVKFSGKDTQDERAGDVKLGRADTDMTPAMIGAIRAIRTNTGKPVFVWGGDWNTVKDSMHFELALTPEEMSAGIDWSTVDRHADPVSHRSFDPDDDFTFIDDFSDVVTTVGMGDAGPLVSALQETLTNLGYWLGKIDGQFGRMTRDALLAFQADNRIPLTGRYDAETIAALKSPEHRPLDITRINDTQQDLINRGSETMKAARWDSWLGIGTMALGALGFSDKHINFVQSLVNAVRSGTGTIEQSTPSAEFIRDTLTQLGQGNANVTAAQIEELAGKVAAAAQSGTNIVPNEYTGDMLDSVLNLGQGLLSANGFGLWPVVAGVGYFIWRNARNAADSRLKDHRTGANRGR
ncbi:peptidoglycan-binding protein [Roseibium sp. M-1]